MSLLPERSTPQGLLEAARAHRELVDYVERTAPADQPDPVGDALVRRSWNIARKLEQRAGAEMLLRRLDARKDS